MRLGRALIVLFALLTPACGGEDDDDDGEHCEKGKRDDDCAQTVSAKDASAPTLTKPKAVVLPGGEDGIGFDDLRYSPELGKIVAPGGQTGSVYLLDPETLVVTAIGGFSKKAAWNGDDTDGVGSVDAGGGWVFAVDRTTAELGVVDPKKKKVVARVKLDAHPDYVRWVEPTKEVWVTEIIAGKIEIFSLPRSGTPTPKHEAFVAVPEIPEGLSIDAKAGRAYTHGFVHGELIAMDIAARTVVGRWKTGCLGAHGLPSIDEKRGFVFAGCLREAASVALDAKHDGKILDTYDTKASGMSLSAYSPSRKHLYFRGDPGTPLHTFAVSDEGGLTLLGTIETADKAHALATDDAGHYYVGDWKNGSIIRYEDPFGAN